ncbi:MAG TPA: histidine phosphatase family protein [Verrucomicrobiae bacterium]|nr:histidine phosphatase family protein [Verrucomicrobiae bacterium]
MQDSKIILVRHGLTEWNVKDLRLGSSDIILNTDGEKQAERNGAYLADTHPYAIWHSGMQRTRYTAEVIARHTHTTNITEDVRLRERDHGDLEGTPRVVEGGVDATSLLSPEEADTRGVESIESTWARITDVYEDIRKQALEGNGTIIVVAHNAPIRLMLAYASSKGPAARSEFACECGSIASISVGETGDTVEFTNRLPA